MRELSVKIQPLHLNNPQLIHRGLYQMLISRDSQTRFCAILALTLATVVPAMASDFEIMQKANELGSVIAAEAFCGLTYDQSAIQAWIAANLPADDMGVPGMITTGVMGSQFNQEQMGESAKTAHCAAITKTAKHYGFVKG